MHSPKHPGANFLHGFALAVIALVLLPACSINVKKYGSVLECHTSKHGSDVEVNKMSHPDRKESKKLTCDNDDSGKTVELKVGTEDNQHIVAVEPQGKGSSFALVYVQTHGKEGMI